MASHELRAPVHPRNPKRREQKKAVGVDFIDPVRSALMGRVRARNSVPEMIVRRTAHRLGYRFRLHTRDLPGTPDLVFPRLRKIILVHGCFWHRHRGCPRNTSPKTRAAFWAAKFAENRKRDARVTRKLTALGWDVFVVWECKTFDSAELRHLVGAFLASRSLNGEPVSGPDT